MISSYCTNNWSNTWKGEGRIESQLWTWPIKTSSLWLLTEMCGHGDGWCFFFARLEEKRFTRQTDAHTCTSRNTPIIPITRLQQGNSRQPDPAMESQVGAVYVSVCACVRWSRLGVRAHAEHLEC